ncbi:MAG TPA: hypothetical protein VGM81_23840 [Burkholderiaceae bacterium]|jgi:hypothetical protein
MMMTKRHLFLGAAALVLAAALGWGDRPLFFAIWLSASWFCLGLMLGAAALGCIHALTGGRWGEVLRPANRALRLSMPGLLLLFLPLLFGMQWLYSWWNQTSSAWFASLFVTARFAVYGLSCWALWRAREPATSGRAAVRLIVWMMLGSMAAADLLMSLTAGWTSSIFGWLALSGQLSGGAAAAVAIAAHQGHGDGHGRRDPVWRDLGNLLLMFVMLQAYLQFMQLLIIWAENLPRETSWYLPRLSSGWVFVGLALVVLQFAVPTLALLWRRVKDDPQRLSRVALGLVAMQALDSAWLVVPSVQPHGYASWWLMPLIFGGMGLLLFGHLLPQGSNLPKKTEAAYG